MADPRDQRDRQVEQILRRVPMAGSVSSACVDAEQLAAWSARTLPAREAAQVEAHLADCADCQAMLAVFVESEPAPAVAAPSTSSWRLRWLVPFAAATAAVFVWALVLREPGALPTAESTVARVEPVAESVPSAPASRAPEPAAEAFADAAAGRRQESAAPARASAAPPSAAPVAAESDLFAASEARREVSSLDEAASAKATASEPVAAPAVGQAQNLTRVTGTAADTAERGAPAPAAPSPPAGAAMSTPPPPASPAERRFQLNAAAPAAAGSPMASVAATMGIVPMHGRVSPNVPVMFGPPADVAGRQLALWRLGSDGRLEHSSDGGQRWVPVDATPALLTAGSAPATNVVWLAGRDGLVMRSTDGVTFDRRSFPEAVILVSIEATDAGGAVATTADGRRFATTDGGVSWRRLD